MPATFQDKTKNDVMIFSRHFHDAVISVQVDQDHLVANHNPLVVQLEVDGRPPMRSFWKLPRSWLCFEPPADLIDQHFQPVITFEDPDQALQDWSPHVESAVDATLKTLHRDKPDQFPQPALPKTFWGRCRPVGVSRAPLTPMIKKAREGDFHPGIAQPIHHIGHLTRQLRRIQSLLRRPKYVEDHPELPPKTEQLQQEWYSIRKGQGMDGSFVDWASQTASVGPPPHLVPTQRYLQRAFDALKPLLPQKIHAFNKQKRDMVQHLRAQDIKHHGKRRAFQQIRETDPGLLFKIISDEVHMPNQLQHGLAQVTLQSDGVPAYLNDARVDIIALDPPSMELVLEDAELSFHAPFRLQQTIRVIGPSAVADTLNGYWNQFWKRDAEAADQSFALFSDLA